MSDFQPTAILERAASLGVDGALDVPLRELLSPDDPAQADRLAAARIVTLGDALRASDLPLPARERKELHRLLADIVEDWAETTVAPPMNDREEIALWAYVRGLRGVVHQPVMTALRTAPAALVSQVRMVVKTVRLRDPLCLDVLAIDSERNPQLSAIKRAMWKHLGVNAEPRREVPLAGPPADAAARALWDLVARVRTEYEPGKASKKGTEPPEMRYALSEDPPQFHFEDLASRWMYAKGVIGLVPDDKGRLFAKCQCYEKSCPHVAIAAEALLGMLAGPDSPSRRRLLDVAAKRPWMHALAELDAILAETSTTEPIGWRIDLKYGELRVGAMVSTLKKNGQPGKDKTLSLPALMDRAEATLSPADRRARAVIAAARRTKQWLPDDASDTLLELVGHPRVSLARDGGPPEPIEIRRTTVEVVTSELERGGVELAFAIDGGPLAPQLVAQRHSVAFIDADGKTCRVAEVTREVRAVAEVLVRRGHKFPAESRAAVVERLRSMAQRVPMQLPADLLGEELPARPRTVLRLAPGDGTLDVDVFVRVIRGATPQRPGEGPREQLERQDGKRVFARRALADEPAFASAAITSLPMADAKRLGPWTLRLEGERGLDLLAALAERNDLDVEWPGGDKRRVTRNATGKDLRVNVEDKHDWFGVEGQIDVDGATVPLADLLAAVRSKQRYVQVKGGAFARIADELRERLSGVADVIFATRGRLEVSSLAAGALAKLADVGATIEAPLAWTELLARIEAAGELSPAAPDELGAALRDYQLAGYQWMSRLAAWGVGGCLADDMGLGKTIQALALVRARSGAGPALVVAPTSVCWNWMREAARWTPGLRAFLYHESDRAEIVPKLGAGDVLVVSYGLLARDLETFKTQRFATLVLDEAHAIKNPSTQRARAIVQLQSDFRMALTGTPIENHLGELWSLFRVIAPGLLGSWEQFRERFATPIERDHDQERGAALAALVRPFLLRRLKSEVARELPARTEITVDVELGPEERRRYDDARLAAAAEFARIEPGEKRLRGASADDEKTGIHVLAALTRLRQLACHPRLFDEDAPPSSAKLERLLELVAELRAEGHRALIFSQFTSLLALVREALHDQGIVPLYLDGQTPPAQRRDLVDAFQSGEGDVFLISLKAGGVGLNLTGADNVIHLDPWWNPAVEDQATDRAHRIGQTRPVSVYRLVARDTIEDAILALHADKRHLVSGVLEGSGAAASLKTEDLLRLLRDHAQA